MFLTWKKNPAAYTVGGGSAIPATGFDRGASVRVRAPRLELFLANGLDAQPLSCSQM